MSENEKNPNESPYNFHKRRAAALLSHYLGAPAAELPRDCKEEVVELVEHLAAMAVHSIAEDVMAHVESAMSDGYATVARLTSEILVMRGAAWFIRIASPILRDVSTSAEAASGAVDLAAKAAGDLGKSAKAPAAGKWSGRVWNVRLGELIKTDLLEPAEGAEKIEWMNEDIEATVDMLNNLGFDVHQTTFSGDMFDTIHACMVLYGGAEISTVIELGKREGKIKRPSPLNFKDALIVSAVSRWCTDLFGGSDTWIEEVVDVEIN